MVYSIAQLKTKCTEIYCKLHYGTSNGPFLSSAVSITFIFLLQSDELSESYYRWVSGILMQHGIAHYTVSVFLPYPCMLMKNVQHLCCS